MKAGMLLTRWRPVLGVVAVCVFAFSLTLRGAPVEKNARPVSEATVGSAQSNADAPAYRQGPLAKVLRRSPADYRKSPAEVAWSEGGALAIGPWPTRDQDPVGGVATGGGCVSDEACSDCNPCTDDDCAEGICVGGDDDGEGCDPADTQDCPGRCTDGSIECRTDAECIAAEAGACNNPPIGACSPFGKRTCVYNDEPDDSHPAGCDDGIYCNGVETCQSGQCQVATTDPCPSIGCDELARGCLDPGCLNDAECEDFQCDEDSDEPGTACTNAEQCPNGLCVTLEGTEDTCNAEGACENRPIDIDGRCCPGPSGKGSCSRKTEAECNADSGVYLPTDEACSVVEPSGNTNDCPDYGAGVAPQGAYTGLTDVITNLTHATCTDKKGPIIIEYIDEYQANMNAWCFEGLDAGEPCKYDADCDLVDPDDGLGTCVKNREYMDIEFLRFTGSVVGQYSARWDIAFYDENGIIVEDVFWPDGQDDSPDDAECEVKTVDFDPPLRIPTRGKVGFSVQNNFSPGGQVRLCLTDVVDVGFNKGGAETIVAMELVGRQRGKPLGACCNAADPDCRRELPWICKNDGDNFQGVGTYCSVCLSGVNEFLPCDPACDENSDNHGTACTSDAGCPGGLCGDDTQCNWVCDDIGTNVGGPCTSDAGCPPNDGPFELRGSCDMTKGHVCGPLPTCNEQSCCFPDGHCEDLETCPVGSNSLGYGTFCQLPTHPLVGSQPDNSHNCCPQPKPTGGDNCNDATMHVLNVPPVSSPPAGVSVTITGNNSTATNDDQNICTQWGPNSTELGWWEAFTITECANVRIDFCCTDIDGEPLRPAWGNLVAGCNPCGQLLQNDGVDKPIGVGRDTSGFARGGPFCPFEDNLWQTYGPLPAGSYFYPVYTVPDGSSGVPPGATYQMHVTAVACPVATCCYLGCSGDPTVMCETVAECSVVGGTCEPQCEVVNELVCEERFGYWMATHMTGNPTSVTCDGDPCLKGGCCTGPGQCVDRDGRGEDKLTCDILDGTYVGGARCENPGAPCPLCEIQRPSNCHMPEDIDFLVALSDKSSPGGATVTADNFAPQGSPISTVCFWGAYLDGRNRDGELDCWQDLKQGGVPDDFLIRVFRDCGGKPCNTQECSESGEYCRANEDCPDGETCDEHPEAMLGESVPAVLYIDDMEDNDTGFGTWIPNYVRTDLRAYQVELATPIPITDIGECHWIEITNDTEAQAGDPPNTCEWWWFRKGAYDPSFEGYSMQGTHDETTGESVYTKYGTRHWEMNFCVDVGMDECPAPEDRPKRACCSCWDADEDPHVCTLEVLNDCIANSEWQFDSDTCVGYTCPVTAPVNDKCENAIDVTPAEGDTFSITYDSICAETNGPDGEGVTWEIFDEGGSFSVFGAELWYKYTTTCTGFLQISTCGVGNNYDNMIAVFEGGCPGDQDFVQVAGADENCNGLHDGGAGLVLLTVNRGETYYIAAGGWEEDGGPGKLDVKCQGARCAIAQPPLEVEKLPDTGYGTRNRYLGFEYGKTDAVAIRVTMVDLDLLHSVCNGQQKWVGQPFEVCELSGAVALSACPNGPRTWLAPLVGAPRYDNWAQYGGPIYLYDEQIVPNSEYHLHALDIACPGTQPADYSDALIVKTSLYGDTVGTTQFPNTCRTAPKVREGENPYMDCWTPPDSSGLSFDDISSTVDKFINLPGAPQKVRPDVAPCTVDFKIDFNDIPAVVDGFLQKPFPCPPPAKCLGGGQ